MGMQRKVFFGFIIAAAVLVAAAWALIAYVFVSSASLGRYEQIKPVRFDSEMWRRANRYNTVEYKSSYLNLREAMFKDLSDRKQLRGLSQVQVHELLGEPTPQEKLSNESDRYWLGNDAIDPMDDVNLVIRYENGIVSDVQLIGTIDHR